MGTIDLHCHSYFSDGSMSPADLVARAAEKGVLSLALTDHDSVRGLDEAFIAAQAHGVELIPGVEISTLWQTKQNIHIVGLQVDREHPALVAALAKQAGARALRAQQIAQKLDAKLKIPAEAEGSYSAVLALAGNADSISRTHFAQWLLEQKYTTNMQQAFDRYLGQGKPADVPIPWMGIAEAINIIKAAGGYAVLAHPGRYSMSRTKLRLLIAEFKALGGDALEVATATEKPDIVRYLGQLAQQNELYASQGSDFHGAHMPWIELGRFPKLPEGCKPVWELWESQRA